MVGYGSVFGDPFSFVVRGKETVAELKVRLAAKLGESAEAAKRSWKLCVSANYKYDVLAEGMPFRYLINLII